MDCWTALVIISFSAVRGPVIYITSAESSFCSLYRQLSFLQLSFQYSSRFFVLGKS